MSRLKSLVIAAAVGLFPLVSLAQAAPDESPVAVVAKDAKWNIGFIFQGGKGVTDNRDDFKFFMAGGHLGLMMTPDLGKSILKGNLESVIDVFPYWQSDTPKFQRYSCVSAPTPSGLNCVGPYTVGGTFHGVSINSGSLRWNFTHGKKIMPWIQGGGGLLWTNHKYPAYGQGVVSLQNSGPNSNTSVWNFTPQFGIGMRYFQSPKHSLDLGANAMHISSASLGDRNPGVNATVQFTIGYTWWKQ